MQLCILFFDSIAINCILYTVATEVYIYETMVARCIVYLNLRVDCIESLAVPYSILDSYAAWRSPIVTSFEECYLFSGVGLNMRKPLALDRGSQPQWATFETLLFRQFYKLISR